MIRILNLNINIKIYRLIIISLFILFCQSKLFPDDKYSDFILTGGIGLNLNFHRGNFKGYSSYAYLNPSFTNGFGLGGRIFAGAEYIFKDKLLGKELHGGFDVSYSNLSSTLIKDEFIGNIITENTYTQGTSEHKLESHISALMIEPKLIIYPFENLPLSAFAGFQFGIPMNMTYYQEEGLIHPDFGTYENGQRVRDTSSGNIPSPASVYFALSLGVRYEIYKSDNFTVLPVINFNFGLTNLSSNVDWKASNLSFSALLQYRIPLPVKKTNPPPVPPPPPPPEEKPMHFALNVFYKDKKLEDGDTIKVKVVDTLYINKYYVSPVIFYAENKTDFGIKSGNPESPEDAQNMSYRAIQFYLAEHPKSKIKIISSAISDEGRNTAAKRLKTFLKKFNIDSSRITKDIKIEDKNKFRIKELEDENRFIKFETDDKEQALNVTFDSSQISYIDDVKINILPDLQNESNNRFEGIISVNGQEVNKLADSARYYDLSGYLNKDIIINNGRITIGADNTDVTGQRITKKMNIYLKAEPYQARLVENLSSGVPGREAYHEYILGFCKFDKSDFYSINYHAVNVIKEAYNYGRKIEIIPLTDSLGTDEYNHILAVKRAEFASKVLSIDLKKIKLTIPNRYLFSNDSPEGRLMNRSVIVRIF